MLYIKTYIFHHFYLQYLVLLTMVPRNRTLTTRARPLAKGIIPGTWYVYLVCIMRALSESISVCVTQNGPLSANIMYTRGMKQSGERAREPIIVLAKF